MPYVDDTYLYQRALMSLSGITCLFLDGMTLIVIFHLKFHKHRSLNLYWVIFAIMSPLLRTQSTLALSWSSSASPPVFFLRIFYLFHSCLKIGVGATAIPQWLTFPWAANQAVIFPCIQMNTRHSGGPVAADVMLFGQGWIQSRTSKPKVKMTLKWSCGTCNNTNYQYCNKSYKLCHLPSWIMVPLVLEHKYSVSGWFLVISWFLIWAKIKYTGELPLQ